MRKFLKFLKDKQKIIKIIINIIIVITFLYALIFDGSEIPFIIAFISPFVIRFIHNVKQTAMFIKNFRYLKKTGIIRNANDSRKVYKQCRDTIHASIISVVLSGVWLACIIFAFTWR